MNAVCDCGYSTPRGLIGLLGHECPLLDKLESGEAKVRKIRRGRKRCHECEYMGRNCSLHVGMSREGS